MKKIACRNMSGGGECDTEIGANTPEEMIKRCMEHMRMHHPEIAEEINKNNSEWRDMIRRKWETMTEV